jgi:hypothetical protein
VTPFTHLTWEDQPFSWGIEAENAFQSLKASLMIASLLIHVNLSKPFVLEMDTFDFALGIVFSQLGKDKFFIQLVFIFLSFLLSRLVTKFMTKNFWPS